MAMPMVPTLRQNDFLRLKCREALYGGAAGGGKSEALLMWLAEGIHLADYSAIIFRRTYKQLMKSNDSLWAKASRLYRPLGAIPNRTDKQWRFPSGALIEMGALEHEDSVEDYQGNSYHRVAYDELTHFSQEQYEYLVNLRIRKSSGYPITLGARAGSNPGGRGHEWVKSRFISDEAARAVLQFAPWEPSPPGLIFEAPNGRMFVPARVADNPYLDREDYLASLADHSNPVTRERMMNGDWTIAPDGLIKPEWIRNFTMNGDFMHLLDDAGNRVAMVDQTKCSRFITVDTAGSTKDKDREAKGKHKSWSVAGVWDYKHLGTTAALICRHVERRRIGFVEMCDLLRQLKRTWNPGRVIVENATMGPDLYSVLRREMQIELITPGGGRDGKPGKVERATKLLNMLAKGEVYLPSPGPEWRRVLEAEWLGWQGLDDETNDQVDMAAYAAMECESGLVGVTRLDFDPRVSFVR